MKIFQSKTIIIKNILEGREEQEVKKDGGNGGKNMKNMKSFWNPSSSPSHNYMY